MPSQAELDDALERKTAETLINQLKRFKITSLNIETEIQERKNKYLVISVDETHQCNCEFFQDMGYCRHTLAVQWFLEHSILPQEKPRMEDYQAHDTGINWLERLQRYSTVDLSIASGLSRTTIVNLKSGNHPPPRQNITSALERGIAILDKHLDFEKWRNMPLSELARILEIDEQDAANFRHGTFKPTKQQRKALLDAMGINEE